MKVDYKKKWGKDGTVYCQTITIDEKMAVKFNEYVEELKNKIIDKFMVDDNEIKILYNLETLENYDNNYTNLTTLDYFIKFYLKYVYEAPKKDKDFERIKWRNTIIKIV